MKQKYMVLVKKGTDLQLFEKFLKKNNYKVHTNFESLKRHYVVECGDNKIAKLFGDERVQHIERADNTLELEIMGKDIRETDDPNDKVINRWNLDRINKRNAFLDDDYSFKHTGKKTDIYILDTGVDGNHPEFKTEEGSRVENLFTAFENNYEDENGHGTHVAGTAAGNTFGVARDAKIYNLRVLNEKGSGALFGVVLAINNVIAHHTNKIENRINRPSVINMSLGSKRNAMIDNALNDALEVGIVSCIAAGNSQASLDVVEVSPAEVINGITVSATAHDEGGISQNFFLGQDKLSVFSNYGSQVDICAPGEDIWSAFPGNKYKRMSGTSMASPLVAGVCAAMLEESNILIGLNEVLKFNDKLVKNSTKDKIKDLQDRMTNSNAPNRMLYMERDPDVKNPLFPRMTKYAAMVALGIAIFIGGVLWLSQFGDSWIRILPDK